MRKIEEVLFIVHPGFDENNQPELEENIKAKIDNLAEGIKKGVESSLVFVDEPGLTKLDCSYDNIHFLHSAIYEYFAFKGLEQFHRESFPEDIINRLIDNKISRFVYENLEILLKDEILNLDNSKKLYNSQNLEFTDCFDFFKENKFEELFKKLLDKIIEEKVILDFNYKDLKLSDIGDSSSKIPKNIERKKSLYYYAVEKLGEERVIQTFMHDRDLRIDELCNLKTKDNIDNILISELKPIQKFIFSERFGYIIKLLKYNEITKFNIGGEYLGRCVNNFFYLIQGNLGYTDSDTKKFVNTEISLIKKGDEKRFN